MKTQRNQPTAGIIEIKDLLEKSDQETCTCYSNPDEGCDYCSIREKIDRIIEYILKETQESKLKAPKQFSPENPQQWSDMPRFHKSPNGGWDFRCFGGWLVCYNRDVFCLWWSNDATPPTKCEGNGFWLIGSYGKWAQSKFA